MPSSEVKSNAGAGARSLAQDEATSIATIVTLTISKIYQTTEKVRQRQLAARQSVQSVGAALSDYGSAPRIDAPAQEVEHWREAISVVAEQGNQMTAVEAKTALNRINDRIGRAGAVNLVVSTTKVNLVVSTTKATNQILEENNLNSTQRTAKASVAQGQAPVQSVTDRSVEELSQATPEQPTPEQATPEQPTPDQLDVIAVADDIYDSPAPAAARHELPPKLMDHDQQMETLGTDIKSDTAIPKYEKEASVESQQASSGPTKIEGQASSKKVYNAEEFRIVREGNKTTIETVNGKKLFEYTKDDSGRVTVTLDKITGNAALRKQFEKAASALRAEPAHKIMKDPSGRKQIDKLGGLAPAGSYAVAVAAYATDAKSPVVATEKYEFRKNSEGYEVYRRGRDIKPQDALLAKNYSDGRIVSTQTPEDLVYMKENFGRMRAKEVEHKKAVEAAAEARATGQPVISRATAIEKERG
ncbi:MAG: hypothetical protein HC800_18605 [Phormidesmis sp. RL_2_1]|nr:hypothetical protein [Phormidesmis sp. RL_2_1]